MRGGGSTSVRPAVLFGVLSCICKRFYLGVEVAVLEASGCGLGPGEQEVGADGHQLCVCVGGRGARGMRVLLVTLL